MQEPVLHSDACDHFITGYYSILLIHYSFGYVILNGVKINGGTIVWKPKFEELYFKNTDEKACVLCSNCHYGTWYSEWVML